MIKGSSDPAVISCFPLIAENGAVDVCPLKKVVSQKIISLAGYLTDFALRARVSRPLTCGGVSSGVPDIPALLYHQVQAILPMTFFCTYTCTVIQSGLRNFWRHIACTRHRTCHAHSQNYRPSLRLFELHGKRKEAVNCAKLTCSAIVIVSSCL